MCQPSLSVWFVCRLCRGSFGQVDAFIEHKKQKHFTQFQNTTCIVFEESEHIEQCPIIIKEQNQPVDENNEPRIKIEVQDEDSSNSFSSEIIDEPNLALVEPKSELITFESEINPYNENNCFGFEQPEQNPYVLLKRLTSDEIQCACVGTHHYGLLKCERKDIVGHLLESSKLSADVSSNINELIEVEKRISTEEDLQFECKLCSKQFESDAQQKIHVGNCALYHKDRNRFCVTCNRKYYDTRKLKLHRLSFHGTEEEKLSLYKFKCDLCPKKYRDASDFRFHLESHKTMKEQVETSKSKPFKCSHPNCGKEFRFNSRLQSHIAAVHLGVKPFSCSFPNCNKTFTLRPNLERHFLIHTGDHPYKCTVDNCNKAFRTSDARLVHLRTVHRNLLSE